MATIAIKLDVFNDKQVSPGDHETPPEYQKVELEEMIVEAAARQLLDAQVESDTPFGPPGTETSNARRTVDLSKMLTKRLSTLIDRRVAEIAESRIAEAVDAALAEGWRKTNTYGEPVGTERITLRERLATRLAEFQTPTDRGSFNERRKVSDLDEMIQARVDAELKRGFSDVIEEAKAKFRAAVDGVVQAKLTETLKSALGIR